jgi:hypothetical protein
MAQTALAAAPAMCVATKVLTASPLQADDAHRHEALHNNRQNIFAAHEPAVEKGQSRRHQHHQGRPQQHPCGVAMVDWICLARPCRSCRHQKHPPNRQIRCFFVGFISFLIDTNVSYFSIMK